MNNFYIPESVMAIVAHPDDIEFSCVGTLARWVQNGARVAYVLCTSGEVGIAEKGMTKRQAAEIREAEQQAAAAIVGVQDPIDHRSGRGLAVGPGHAVKTQMAAGMAHKGASHFGQGLAGCGDYDRRDRRIRVRFLGQQGDGARAQGFADMAVAVVTGSTEAGKEPTRFDLAGVIG